jgi:hypothetical protein
LPRHFTIEARDPINEIFRTSSETLIQSSDPKFFFWINMTLPLLWIRALENWGYPDLDIDEVVNCSMTWRNTRNAGASFTPNKNYLGSYVLRWPSCLIGGRNVRQVINTPGRIYSESAADVYGRDTGGGIYGEQGSAVIERKENIYYTIGEVVLSLLEAFDLVMVCDSGQFWFIQREHYVNSNWVVATQVGPYTISSTAPNYGFEELNTAFSSQFTIPQVYAQGLFTGRRRLWKIKHLYVNQKDPIFASITADAGQTPDNFWNQNQFVNVNGTSATPQKLILQVNENSFDFVKISCSLSIIIDRWANTFYAESGLDIEMRVFAGSQGWVNGRTNVSGPNNAWFRVANVSPFSGSISGSTYTRNFEFLIGPPDGGTLTDIEVQFRAVARWVDPNAANQFASVLNNRAGRENLVRGNVSASLVTGFQTDGGKLFETFNDLNEQSQEISDRGQLLFENILGNLVQFQIGTLEDGQTPLIDAAVFNYLPEWQRLNTETPSELSKVRGREMAFQARRPSLVYEGEFRNGNYVGAHLAHVYDGGPYRIIHREFSANTGYYSIRMLQARRQVAEVRFTGNPLFDGALLPDTSMADGTSTSGNISGGRISNNTIGIVGVSVYQEDTSPASIELSQLFTPLRTGWQVQIMTGGYVVAEGVVSADYEPGENINVDFSSISVYSTIPEGAQVAISMVTLLNALFEPEEEG